MGNGVKWLKRGNFFKKSENITKKFLFLLKFYQVLTPFLFWSLTIETFAYWPKAIIHMRRLFKNKNFKADINQDRNFHFKNLIKRNFQLPPLSSSTLKLHIPPKIK